MKRAAILAAILFSAAGATVSTAAPSSGGSSAVAVLRQEVADLNARNWKPYYALMGPRFHATCTYRTFVAQNAYVRTRIKSASVKMIAAKVIGARAYLSYETVAPPLKPFVTRNDLFVKLSGRWYDELDAVTHC